MYSIEIEHGSATFRSSDHADTYRMYLMNLSAEIAGSSQSDMLKPGETVMIQLSGAGELIPSELKSVTRSIGIHK